MTLPLWVTKILNLLLLIKQNKLNHLLFYVLSFI